MSDLPEAVMEELQWVVVGVDKPLLFSEALLRVGFLMLKDGRDSNPREPKLHELNSLSDKYWYAINPRYHAGLQLEGYRNTFDAISLHA